MKKVLLVAMLAAGLWACGSKDAEKEKEAKRNEEAQETLSFDDNFDYLVQCCMDSTVRFKEYEAQFKEFLDSVEYYVYSDDADMRYEVRGLPITMLGRIYSSTPEEDHPYLEQYHQRCVDLLYTWYAQHLTDTASNEPFIILSYAAVLDDNIQRTRMGFTFSEAPSHEPVLMITLPLEAYDDNPLICLIPQDDDEDVYVVDEKEMQVFGNKGEMVNVALFGDVVRTMIESKEIDVLFKNENVKKYKDISHAPYEECVTQVSVGLDRFREQYKASKAWLDAENAKLNAQF